MKNCEVIFVVIENFKQHVSEKNEIEILFDRLEDWKLNSL